MEHIRDDGLSRFTRDLICLDRKAIVAEKALDEARFAADLFARHRIRFLDVTPDFLHGGEFHYVAKHRHLKAMKYLRKGYRGHAIAKEKEIIGDTWFYPNAPTNRATDHPDLKWLGLELREGCVYTFDIYLAREARGANLSAALQTSSMHALRQKGFTTAYAYYWTDNTPAVWNTRVINKWRERKVLRVRSIFLYRRVIEERPLPISSTRAASERDRR